MVLRKIEEEKYSKVVLSDIRFLNEIRAIQGAGGKLVRIKRNEMQPTTSHATEAEQLLIPDQEFDYVLDNTKVSLDQVQQRVESMCRDLGSVRKKPFYLYGF
jgi:hypothetical protein